MTSLIGETSLTEAIIHDMQNKRYSSMRTIQNNGNIELTISLIFNIILDVKKSNKYDELDDNSSDDSFIERLNEQLKEAKGTEGIVLLFLKIFQVYFS